MRLGGLVIHGNAPELSATLDSLQAVCDEVVAVDSGSTDGSAELVRARRIRRVELSWRGYGAARAAAAAALADCDYFIYLDSDERLDARSIEILRAWKGSQPTARAYRLYIRDWADLPTGRFMYRLERHVRLVRREAALWAPAMIVHEGLSRKDAPLLDAVVEHRFASSIDSRAAKEDRYALLWAVQAASRHHRTKPAWLQRPMHVLRDCLVKGALFRGGWQAVRLAWAGSRYHARKYRYLTEIRAGQHAEAVRLYADGQYRALFEHL
jgi:glycosyltransferase involved in cell wall biosynthesis